MAERQWVEKKNRWLVRETIGDHVPQTPALVREFGEHVDGISRGYEMAVKFNDGASFSQELFGFMYNDWCNVVPDNYRTVWCGYVTEPHFAGEVQVGYKLKSWFFAYKCKAESLPKNSTSVSF